MSTGSGDDSRPATGLKPGTLTAFLRELAAGPASPEVELPRLEPGTVLGRFEIRRELGHGGFGVVYEAQDRDLGRLVALKLIRPGRAEVEEGRVDREAEAVARLSHPNLITLFEVGRADGRPFLVFELLRGRTLQERMDEGPLPLGEAVRIAIEVARGLAHAHAEGVVHRDLKPSNVFLTSQGQVKILDFGLALAFGRRRPSGGTPAYMAPEQWEDDPEDERTDVFALGVMLYAMLSDALPYPEGKGRWAAEPARVPALDVPGAPGLWELIEAMLDRTPRRRPRDGAAVLAALEPIDEALGSRSPTSAPRAAAPAAKRRRALPLGRWAGLVLAAGAVSAAGWYAWTRVREVQPEPATPQAIPSVAVLPFADLSQGGDQAYFADGVAEEILAVLSKVPGVRVAGRASSFYFRKKDLEPAEIGRKLGVAHLLEGSVRRAGSRLRISAELIRTADGERLWHQAFDRELTDVFAIQDEIARAVVGALRPRLVPGEQSVPSSIPTGAPEAYQEYLLGKRLLTQNTPEADQRAVEAFERAMRLDPGYAPAWGGLAEALYITSEARSSVEEILRDKRRALDVANRAIGLAPGNAEAYAARANLVDIRGWDWLGAIADASRAVELSPQESPFRMTLGLLLAQYGRSREGLQDLELATQLDPLNARAWAMLSWVSPRGEWKKAAWDRVREISPDSGWTFTLMEPWNRERALAHVRRKPTRERDPNALDVLVSAHVFLGQRAEALRVLDELLDCCAHNGAFQIAYAYDYLGDPEKTCEWLDRARLQTDSGIRGLKFTTRFNKLTCKAELLRKMNLPADPPTQPAAPVASSPAVAPSGPAPAIPAGSARP